MWNQYASFVFATMLSVFAQAPTTNPSDPPAPGSATFTIPEGAISYRWVCYDEDFFSDDKLSEGKGEVPAGSGGASITIDPELYQESGEVVGALESSGEDEAEIYIQIVFEFPGGATETTSSEPTEVLYTKLKKKK